MSYLVKRFLSLVMLSVVSVTASAATPDWQALDSLIKAGKYQDVSVKLDDILNQAIEEQDNKTWREALLMAAAAQAGNGAEKGLALLAEKPWPEDKDSQLLINLHYAALFEGYISQNSWQIRNRETIESSKPLSLEQKTMAQLLDDQNQAFTAAYTLSEGRYESVNSFGKLPLENLDSYFNDTGYPERVRGSIHDTVVYLWVNSLKNTSLWSPTHSNQAKGFSAEALLARPYADTVEPSDETQHPLKRAISLLNGLEDEFSAKQQTEAALEAFLTKIDLVYSQHGDSAEVIVSALRERDQQEQARGEPLPWAKRLPYTIGLILSQQDEPDSLIRSLAALEPCLNQLPKDDITLACQSIADNIQLPTLRMLGMQNDGLGKRSIELTHSNLDVVYFRAWKLDADQVIKRSRYNNPNELRGLLDSQTPADATWQSGLPATTNYRPHKTFITPEITQHGYWLVAASNTPDFSLTLEESLISSVEVNLSNLVAEVKLNKGDVQLAAYLGETGQLLPGATVEVWQNQNSDPSIKVLETKTGNDGLANFTLKERDSFSLRVIHDSDVAIVNNIYNNAYREAATPTSALLFTDRAIYRPSQKILWKIVAYQGSAETSQYQVLPNTKGTVELLDVNGEIVEKLDVTTNEFGSASGEFTAKEGLLLGNWYMRSSWGSNQSIRVEAYKRPTFKAEFNDPETELRLNTPATVTGSAQYYFGGAVSTGKVSWQVKREAQFVGYPRYSRGGYIPPTRAETIASGTTELDKDGLFTVEFNPAVAEAEKDQIGTYAFTVTADITDAGGETRTASRTFNLASIAISAQITPDAEFAMVNEPFSINISRQDPDGNGRAGDAEWKLLRLIEPEQVLMPADQDAALPEPDAYQYATPGDLLKARWDDSNNALSSELFEVGDTVSSGNLQHNEEGIANLSLTAKQAGHYRLQYSTTDKFGKAYTTTSDFIVASAAQTPLTTPTILRAKQTNVEVGDSVSLLAGSGFADAPFVLEVYHGNELLSRTVQNDGIKTREFPVEEAYRGGLTFVLSMLKDYQLIRQEQFVNVPWTNKQLNVAFSTFRDKLRPGQQETWRVTVEDADGQPLESGAVEVLASMFDRSLEFLAPHSPPTVNNLYRARGTSISRSNSLGVSYAAELKSLRSSNYFPSSVDITLNLLEGVLSPPRMELAYAVAPMMMAKAAPAPSRRGVAVAYSGEASADEAPAETPPMPEADLASGIEATVRTNFNETAFFKPNLVLEADGSVAFEFEVPESLTQWKVWASALTKDLRGGTATAFSRTSKELMVRPYLPRFLRAGDEAKIEVVINNAGDKPLSGQLSFDIIDTASGEVINDDFNLQIWAQPFNVKAGESSNVSYTLSTPNDLGIVAVRAKATAYNGIENFADGEQRPLPVLPSRLHLTQSRFAALKGNSERKLEFSQLADDSDTTRINDKLVVTVDGQLFYSTLKALPYLNDYPYECTEQTFNRFLSTSIITKTFEGQPLLAAMAKKLSERDSQFENWEAVDQDPNRKMLLEETPWLDNARGGATDSDALLNILDPEVAASQQKRSIEKLLKAQLPSGAFPWWEGGQASPYMTLYLLQGFSKALEFGVEIPKPVVQGAWQYIHQYYLDTLLTQKPAELDVYSLTALSYVLSAYPDSSWTGGVFSDKEQAEILQLALDSWLKLAPMSKAQLALSLHRAGREGDARLVFDSVMNTAKTDDDLGTYWPEQSRSWLWYNDRIDTHAFILRAMMELNPQDERRHGMVQWLMLNKQLNHWKSTRATAESIYSLVHYLKQEGQLGEEERVSINIGDHVKEQRVFKPDEYTGANNQIVVEGNAITPDMASISFTNETKALMFASATWHFSTETLPEDAQGDFFKVSRTLFKRVQENGEWVLKPLAEGATVAVGDELEVQLSLSTKHAAEYVHLRAPRGAGFEPMESISGYRWDGGAGYYQEVRDSGANYFFEWLPTGKYAFKYRLRATTAGKFRVGPATVQSIYAPEFNAYSSGTRINIE
ncbi:alpha-2-macroglobulin family protein [Leucothrix mucor]|uniref:alpha-2-macroglobulin family protein n=1 Tax=Leucothrix mucor TaxID=45248 RepID=UPI0003B484F7|nr:alpha-2-macroglobulin family protein [Leucothrix mucor]